MIAGAESTIAGAESTVAGAELSIGGAEGHSKSIQIDTYANVRWPSSPSAWQCRHSVMNISP